MRTRQKAPPETAPEDPNRAPRTNARETQNVDIVQWRTTTSVHTLGNNVTLEPKWLRRVVEVGGVGGGGGEGGGEGGRGEGGGGGGGGADV